jgi:hypothetical protein
MTVYAELLAAAKAVCAQDDGDRDDKAWDRLRYAIEACERKMTGRQLIGESTDRLVPRLTESQDRAKRETL